MNLLTPLERCVAQPCLTLPFLVRAYLPDNEYGIARSMEVI